LRLLRNDLVGCRLARITRRLAALVAPQLEENEVTLF
jgi:hypothetical protein